MDRCPDREQAIGRLREFYGSLGTHIDRIIERRCLLVLMAVLVLGAYFRLRRLGAAPLWIDEAYVAWAARNFLGGQGFSDPIGASSPYRRAWLTTSLPIAGSFAVFGFSEFAARLPVAIYGSSAILVAYGIAARYSRLLGYLVAAFVAFDPFVVVWSREARMYGPLLLFTLAALYGFVRWYADDDLQFRSPNGIVTAMIGLVGVHTHAAFGAVAGGLLLFLIIASLDRVQRLDSFSPRDLDDRDRRLLIVTIVGAVGTLSYLALQGLPVGLFAEPGGPWPERGPTYYWDLFGRAYPLLNWLVFPGIAYAWFRHEGARPLVLAFVLSIVLASLSPRKAPRYVSHLVPLVGLFGLLPVADGLEVLWHRVTEDGRPGPFGLSLSYAVPVVIVLVVASPLAGYAVADATHDPPYHPERSSWDSASEYINEHADNDDVIASTRPEVSMWYLGRTDYFFRQNGIDSAQHRGGELIHTRTGAVYLNDTAAVRRLMNDSRDVWLLAGKKFHTGFTDSTVRRLIKEEFRLVAEWRNMELYHYEAKGT